MSTTTNRTAVRFCVSNEITHEPVIACPCCGSSNVHLGELMVDQGNTLTRHVGGEVYTVAKPASARGSVVRQEMWCESGHVFAYQYSFHKGNTFVELETGEWDRCLDDETCFSPQELWRD